MVPSPLSPSERVPLTGQDDIILSIFVVGVVDVVDDKVEAINC